MTLYGIERVGPSSFNDEPESGAGFSAALRHEFIGELIQHDVPLDGVMYGVSWPADDHVPPQTITYFCGTQSATSLEGLQTLVVEGGSYFEYCADVPARDLDLAFRNAYVDALPASELTPREGQHIEVYGDEYDPSAQIANFRILIPVE